MAASFRRPGGQALARGSVRISIGANSRSYPLDENGELRLAGLPREGALLLTLFGQGEQELGNMAVAFSTGAVIDASTDRAGAGYVVVREDTAEVALEFTLCGGGRLRCALLLT